MRPLAVRSAGAGLRALRAASLSSQSGVSHADRHGRSLALRAEEMSVRGLAAALRVSESELLEMIADLGEDAADPTAPLELEVAQLLAQEHGAHLSLSRASSTRADPEDSPDAAAEAHEAQGKSASRAVAAEVDEDDESAPRPAVVAVMGHVDHGKTSLLDALRSTSRAAGEAGGITQRLAAFSSGGLTWLDTPGHALFTAMRARGAALTDVGLLVVAADQGAQPQTAEAVRVLREGSVPFIVALNKMDKPGADANAARLSLLEHGVVAEELGGDVPTVEVSASKRTNLDAMCELLQMQAELLELRARPGAPVGGAVLEADVTPQRGVLATVLLSQGTLRTGDIVVAGMAWARVRALTTDDGRLLSEVGAGVPVSVAGFRSVPAPGERLFSAASERRARQLVGARERRSVDASAEEQRAARRRRTAAKAAAIARASSDGAAELLESLPVPVVAKAESGGGLEALVSALATIPAKRAHALVVQASVGQIGPSDVELAETCGAAVLGYAVSAPPAVQAEADRRGVRIATSPVIYTLVDDARSVLCDALPPDVREDRVGQAEVLASFTITATPALVAKGAPKRPTVGGMRVVTGELRAKAHLRVLRAGAVVHEGAVLSLRHFKDDVTEVSKGSECGVILEGGWADWQQGDEVECIHFTETRPTLE